MDKSNSKTPKHEKNKSKSNGLSSTFLLEVISSQEIQTLASVVRTIGVIMLFVCLLSFNFQPIATTQNELITGRLFTFFGTTTLAIGNTFSKGNASQEVIKIQ